MRWVVRILAALVVLAAGMGNAQPAQKRIALIIGNADYDLNGRIDLSEAAENEARRTGHRPDLANAINDARDIRDALARLGFDVSSYKENASKVDMIALLDSFGRKVTAAGPDAIVLVYFSGHGMQIEGENFLIPSGGQLVGADFSQMSASAMQAILSGVAVPTSFLRAQLKPRTGDGVNIIILDACRNNPWDPARRGGGGRGRGLADQDWGLGQTLIAFSTAPGTTAYDGAETDRNSPYTAALKATIGRPNLDVFNMFNTVSRTVEAQTRGWRDGAQRPWINSVTLPNVCLAGCTSTASDVDRSERPPPPAPKTRPGETFKECDVCPEMVVVPAGRFLMGSPESEAERNGAEGPQRDVTISRPFAVGRFEVTFAQWDACVAAGGCAPPEQGPYGPSDEGWGRESRPVINVSWQDAKRFVRFLNGRVGGKAYRLLTEAEWEYAARARTVSAFSTGPSISPSQAQFNHRESYAGSPVSPYRPSRTAPVGQFAANAFGLYDMHGNVWEWVEDCFTAQPSETPVDGSAHIYASCQNRVFRGGSFLDPPGRIRSAIRAQIYVGSEYKGDFLGFRVARTL